MNADVSAAFLIKKVEHNIVGACFGRLAKYLLALIIVYNILVTALVILVILSKIMVNI